MRQQRLAGQGKGVGALGKCVQFKLIDFLGGFTQKPQHARQVFHGLAQAVHHRVGTNHPLLTRGLWIKRTIFRQLPQVVEQTLRRLLAQLRATHRLLNALQAGLGQTQLWQVALAGA